MNVIDHTGQSIPVMERPARRPGCGTYRLCCRCGCISFHHAYNLFHPSYIHGLKVLQCRQCQRRVAVPYEVHACPEHS